MAKTTRFPTALISGDYSASSLMLDGGSVIDQCIVTAGEKGTFFLEKHLLYVVLGGSVDLTFGRQRLTVAKNQMVLLRRAQSVEYVKHGADEGGLFESLLFAIDDDLLMDFLTSQNVTIPKMSEVMGTHVCPMSEKLIAYCWALSPYFDDPSQTNPGLLRLKVMEMLYLVMECSKNTFRQMLQLRQPVKTDVRRVVEENYTSPVSLADLAYLSGRSLSSFKRDFLEIYGCAPANWIRVHRLEKARDLLASSSMSVADVCYSLGFENTSHFSRIFKQRFGVPPSSAAKP